MSSGIDWSCDWPDGGKTCGARAEWYIPGVNSDRPICTGCLAKVKPQPADHYSIEHIDPARVPGPTFVPPADPWAATRISGAQAVHTSGFVSSRPTGSGEAYSSAQPNPMPPQPSRPPLKDAFADLASALLSLGLEKVTEWRKR